MTGQIIHVDQCSAWNQLTETMLAIHLHGKVQKLFSSSTESVTIASLRVP